MTLARVLVHGVDLVHLPRIERIWREHGDHFLRRIYTAAEREYCLDGRVQVQRLAGRFAVKEAVMKALGTGWRGGIEWTDIETIADPLGKPVVSLHGQTAQAARDRGITHWLVSISHAGEYALASAIGGAGER